MTLNFPADKRCALCEHISSQTELLSSNSFGPPDLDTRPAEMMRSTMHTWVQKCPRCGYCNSDISEGEESLKAFIESEEYLNQLHNGSIPDLANSLLCYSLILVHRKSFQEAAWAYLQAAWDCDDHKEDVKATIYRKKAIELFLKANPSREDNNNQVGSFDALLTDLYRRSGQFELAEDSCMKGITKNPDSVISDILDFEKVLITREDRKCYTMDDIKVN